MKADDCKYSKLINGTLQFVIPVFQRDYRWTEAECDQLWRDIIQIAEDQSDRGHFIGSVVYISTGDSSAAFTRWLLIDGQQRVTTLTLLLAALRDHIIDTGWSGGDDAPTVKKVDAYFLKNVEEDGDRRHKLVLRRHDRSTLEAILDGTKPTDDESERLRENYEWFREHLVDADPEQVYRGIGRLVVVDVRLDRGTDDPQLIFESLNSTGMDLSQSDLIRNFILMGLDEKNQTRLYETYWSKIEQLFRGSKGTFDAFIRDFLALRSQTNKQVKGDDIYMAFRREFGFIGDDLDQLDALLQELLRFAGYHAAFSLGVDAPLAVREPLARLRRLVDAPAILVMRLSECHDVNGTLSDAQLNEAITLIESYVFRRAICGEQTRGYWQIFANLAYKIDPNRPLESLKVGLARHRDNYRFPDNDAFKIALVEREIYRMRVCHVLLDRLENEDNNEPADTSRYTIEHIMPQNENLLPAWREMLGDQWQEIQRVWLHRLGNLTLTGYNSKYSDRAFEEKKTIDGGFAESSVRLNKFVREQDQWTPTEMEPRGQSLAQRAISIWPTLEVVQSLIDAAEQADLQALAERRDVAKVPMSKAARVLFEQLQPRIREIDGHVTELAEPKSVSYHGPTFFMEVLPRKNRINLLLAIEFGEVADANGVAKDTSQRKFFVNAQHEGGVSIRIESQEDIDAAMPIIRQSHALVSS